MPIEFHCPHCQKFLKTADDKAGREANCPGCGESIVVPLASTAPTASEVPPPLPGEVPPPLPVENATAAASTSAADQRPCPMCGEPISVRASRCRFCGETVQPLVAAAAATSTLPRGDRPVEFGEIMNAAWKIFSERMGLCLGAFLVAAFLPFIPLVGSVIAQAIAESARDQMVVVIAVLCQLAALFVCFLLQVFLMLGQFRLLLNLVTTGRAEFGTLFSQSKLILPGIGVALLVGLMYIAGFIACVVPGVMVLFLFSPAFIALVDRDQGVMDALQTSYRQTSINVTTWLLIYLVGFGLTMLGAVMCYIGMLFTAPLVLVLQVVGYVMLSGRSVYQPRSALR